VRKAPHSLDALRRDAREIFGDVLAAVDARRAVLDAVEVRGTHLRVCDAEFDLRARKCYSVAVGKAAAAMASALDERLGERLARGVISATPSNATRTEVWRVFAGGHPLPNESSLEAARAAFELLREADDSSSLILFLVSGGGSAMIEWPRDPRVTLEDLREANRVLVSCGAGIDEVNAVRRALSAVKGGGLCARAPRAAQVTLIISDVAADREYDVASGPTLAPPGEAPAALEVVGRFGLASRLPASILKALEEADARPARAASPNTPPEAATPRAHVEPAAPNTEDASPVSARRHHVLLDNERACAAAAEPARARGYAVEFAHDLSEQPVGAGVAALVSRLAEFHRREGTHRREGARGVCLISGGEFACPVRGAGVGGRNLETALRCAFEFEKLWGEGLAEGTPRGMVALSAGTDGVDGNSPAAGALADHTTLRRSRERGLDALKFLEESDAYSFFDRLGDAVNTGPTGTNVRDVRILLAS
jgi:hydroxypyruvate reductase